MFRQWEHFAEIGIWASDAYHHDGADSRRGQHGDDVVAALAMLPFLLMETVFMASNLTKFLEGGFVPVLLAAGLGLLIAISARTDEARAVRDRLAANRDTLAAARQLKQSALVSARESRDEYLAEELSLAPG